MEQKEMTPKELFDEEMKIINKNIRKKNGEDEEDGLDATSGYSKSEYEEDVKVAEEVMDEDGWDEEGEAENEPILSQDIELDKNLGVVKHSANKVDYDRQKLEKTRHEVLNKLKQTGSYRGSKLSPDNIMKLTAVMSKYEKGEIKNPVVLHLIRKKLDSVKEYSELSIRAKELQLEVVQKLAKVTDEIMYAKNKADNYDSDILELADQLD